MTCCPECGEEFHYWNAEREWGYRFRYGTYKKYLCPYCGAEVDPYLIDYEGDMNDEW